MAHQNSDLNTTLKRMKGVLGRRCWWILLSTWLVSMAVIGLSYLLPNHYRSEAIILMATPRISQQYVVPNNTSNNMESIDAVTRGIFSRERLIEIVNKFGLYPNLRQSGNLELSERMRDDIEILPLMKNPERRPMNTFLIAFTANDPGTAQKVTNRLTELFIEENKQNEQRIDTGTTSFLEQELQSAQSDLDRQQQALQSFTQKNLGHLPEQQNDNLQALTGLQLQLQTVQAELTRARQQRTYLLVTQSSAESGVSNPAGVVPGSVAALQDELKRLRRERDDLLSRYSPKYPDVIAVNQQIADKEVDLSKAVNAAKAASTDSSNSTPASASQLVTDPAAVQLRNQLQANDAEIQEGEKRAKQLEAQIATYQQQLSLTPVRARELSELQRTYDLAKAHYADLLSKKMQSALATKLAAQQSSAEFRIIDSATLPSKPSGPPRQKIAFGGLLCGLGLGLGLAFVLEAHDRSLHSEDEARVYLPVPMVIGIPPLPTFRENFWHATRMVLGWTVGCLMLLLIGAAQFYVFRNG